MRGKPMSEKREIANRRNAKMSTGPTSDRGKQRSARNAVKHGLSIPIDPASDAVKALAALLSDAPANDRVASLAVEAARRIMDFERVKEAYRAFYALLGNRPVLTNLPPQWGAELDGLAKLAASVMQSLQPPTPPAFTLSDLAKQLDKLARYNRRALSSRDRALNELADAIDGATCELEPRNRSDN
jgi:hypothetical protein